MKEHWGWGRGGTWSSSEDGKNVIACLSMDDVEATWSPSVRLLRRLLKVRVKLGQGENLLLTLSIVLLPADD